MLEYQTLEKEEPTFCFLGMKIYKFDLRALCNIRLVKDKLLVLISQNEILEI